jgi:hypothetical protein
VEEKSKDEPEGPIRKWECGLALLRSNVAASTSERRSKIKYTGKTTDFGLTVSVLKTCINTRVREEKIHCIKRESNPRRVDFK